MRRGGARQTVSDRVTFRGAAGAGVPPEERQGWALNVSRGGIRAILDDESAGKIELGQEYEIFVGDVETATGRQGRIVWLQEEPDGFVVGIEYIGLSGTHRAAAADASGAVPSAVADSSAPALPDGDGDGEAGRAAASPKSPTDSGFRPYRASPLTPRRLLREAPRPQPPDPETRERGRVHTSRSDDVPMAGIKHPPELRSLPHRPSPCPSTRPTIPGQQLVYFHNHSDSGLPVVIVPEHNS